MAKDKIQAIKGMADMLPEDTPYWISSHKP